MKRHHFMLLANIRDVFVVLLSVAGILLMITMFYAIILQPLYDSRISFCVRALVVMIVLAFVEMLFDMGIMPCIISHYAPKFNSEMIHINLESYVDLPLDLLDIVSGYAIQHRV